MEHTIFLDIETIPAQGDDKRAALIADMKPPSNYKSEEAIAKWRADKEKEAVAKTSLDPAHGHICTISWAVDDEDPDTAHMRAIDGEADVLRAFFGSLTANHRYTFVGHYVGGFDLRFILCRAVVLGVPIPRCIPRDPKPWDSTIFDTMTAWAGQRGTVSMDNLCAALGIDGKGDFSGKDVAQAWVDGRHADIAEYCADDVRRTRAIWTRFQAVNW